MIEALALVALIHSAPQTEGGWRFAEWGMTESEIITAGGPAVERVPDDQIRLRSTFLGADCTLEIVDSPAVGGAVPDQVNLCFSGGRLVRIDMEFPGSQFSTLERALAGRFGQPVASGNGMLPDRTYRGEGNTMRLIRITATILSYSPQASGF